MHWSKFLKPVNPRKTVILQPLKRHPIAMAIGLLSILVACWVEPLIPQDTLDIFVMSTLMALGIALWIQLRSPRISILCSTLAVCFHYCCGSCFVRQAAIAFIIVGYVITFWHFMSQRKSKTKTKAKI